MSSNYDAENYHLFTGTESIKGDIEWYVSLAEEAASATHGEVLELGAGTGRTLLPVARAGMHITGLEADDGMLAKLEELLEGETETVRSRVTLQQGDMRAFDLGRERFSLVQIPFRAFLHCLTRAAQLQCLRCIHTHLRPGGLIGLNVFFPSLDYMSNGRGSYSGVWRHIGEVEGSDGSFYQRSEMSHHDAVRQRLSARLRTERFDVEGRLVETFMQRLELAYLYPADLERLLEEAGFHDVRIEPDFHAGELNSEQQEIAVRARKR